MEDETRNSSAYRASMSRTLAKFCHSFSLGDVDGSILSKTRLHILDTLGAGIAGRSTPEAVAARTALTGPDGGNVPVWGTDISTTAPLAALVNGIASHALELDDTDGCDHSGAVVLPAVLSMVNEAADVSGADILRATILGYETAHRVLEASGGYAACNELGWHSTGTCGSFGATTGASAVLNLSETELVSALGLAGSFTGGLWAFIGDGSMSKRLHAGRAAENGVVSTLLAHNGFTGPSDIFEASWGGYFSTYVPLTATPEKLVAGLGETWRISQASFKPYASCRDTHGLIDIILDRTAQAGALRIDSVDVRMSQFSARMCGGKTISSLVDAQMSAPYCIAAALLHGDVNLQAFSSEVRNSQSMREMLYAINVKIDENFAPNESSEMCLTYTDGSTETFKTRDPLGSAGRPMSESQVVAKFTDLATREILPEKAERIVETVLNLESLQNAKNLTSLLNSGPK